MAPRSIASRTVLKVAGLAIVTGLSVVACGSGDGDAGVTATAGEGTSTSQAETSDVTLRIWSNHPEWKDPFESNLASFEEMTGITLQLEPKPGPEYVQALTTAMQAGEGPDLPGIFPGPLVDEFYNSGLIEDLSGQVGVDRLTDLAQARVRVEDAVVGSPFGKYTVGIYYHVDLFEENGLSVPTTWDEFLRVSEDLLAAGETPLMMPARDGVIPSFYYMLFIASVLGEDGFEQLLDGERQLTDPDLVDAINFLIELEPFYAEGFAGIAYADGKASFARGDTAMILGGTADYAGYVEVNPDLNVDFFAFPPPTVGSGSESVVSGLELIYTVNSASEHQEEAAQFIDWLTTPESNALFANSITLPTVEGVTPGENPIWEKQQTVSETVNEMPMWRDVNATNPVWNVLTENMQLVLLHELAPDQLAQMAQDALVVSD